MKDTLENKITEALQEFVGEENNEATHLRIGFKLAEVCRKYPPTGELKVNKNINMWSDMKFKEKVLWFVCNKLFKIIGKSYRDLMHEYIINSKTIVSHKSPCWMESQPKSVLICDVTYTPVTSTESININL